ncbi:MAG: DNA polymerase III subunit gamma/tau [Nitrospinota bacterium]|nr:DNA polymerase III subunit gamma/tau [Nitrospinota bacterium]
MDFQVSARKWRPQKFSELIGQEHIVRTLHNAIGMDRVAHAYLFSGTRGVGKTTTARLLAKALNCAEGPTPEPCDQCNFCKEIRDGISVDVMEIDGASNNGVGEVRDLIDNIQYSTSACRFKVYIIDEVHMLSKNAFNALLKTLEEPPPQVVFIFATTELTKIPETILSRCQCFEFKPLTHQQIIDQLQAICKHDGITIDPHSLEEIAKNGAGSMRDAQSLLDQVIAFCGKEIDPGAVEAVLGIVGQNALAAFVDCIQQRDAAGLLQQVSEVIVHGKDLGYFCRDLIEYLRNLMLVKVAGNAETLLSGQTTHWDTLKKQAASFQPDELQQMFQVLSKAEMEMKRSSLPQIVFEMAVLRLTDVRPMQEIDALIDKINRMEAPAPAKTSAPLPGRGDTPPIKKAAPAPAQSVPKRDEPVEPPNAPSDHGRQSTVSETSSGASPAPPSSEGVWQKIRAAAGTIKRPLGTYLDNCQLTALDAKEMRLSFPDPYTMGLVEKDENFEALKEAVAEVCGKPDMKIKLQLGKTPSAPAVDVPDPPEPEEPKGKSHKKKGSSSEEEVLKDALDIFGGIVIR